MRDGLPEACKRRSEQSAVFLGIEDMLAAIRVAEAEIRQRHANRARVLALAVQHKSNSYPTEQRVTNRPSSGSTHLSSSSMIAPVPMAEV
jgi:hypothetical protein